VKAVIVDAYEQGRMLAVLSFVRMLLEPAMSSRVFRPPNPWLMSILSLLVEVYHLDHLKTGLKFEVELLLKCMDMQLADVAPSTLLAGRRRESLDNADFQATRPASQGGAAPHPPPATAGTPSKSDAPAAAAAAAAADSRPAPPAPGAGLRLASCMQHLPAAGLACALRAQGCARTRARLAVPPPPRHPGPLRPRPCAQAP
jgi:CCR4-NOT transcription complex subunit 1